MNSPCLRRGVIVCSLVGLTVLVYAQVLQHEFVNLDTDQYVYDNPRVKQGLTVDGTLWAFTTNRLANWHPLTWLSLMLDVEIYGLNPAGFHATNVLLHAGGVLCLFAALCRMTGSAGLWPSAFVAAVYAVHPLHVESVAWVGERKGVLSLFFGFACLWAYARYARRPTRGRMLTTSALLALSLSSKQTFVTLPFALLLLDVWPLRRLSLPGKHRAGNEGGTAGPIVNDAGGRSVPPVVCSGRRRLCSGWRSSFAPSRSRRKSKEAR